MQGRLVTVTPGTPVDIMREKAARRLPVVDPDSALGRISAAEPNT
ncbi:CBS domain-containing protein [Streptomyces africanus]|nr:CBS domain-containing protein [Streptomyces africanus]